MCPPPVCLPPSFWLEAKDEEDTEGQACGCLQGGGRTGGQSVLESWGFPELRSTEATVTSLPCAAQDTGPDSGLRPGEFSLLPAF